MDRFPFHHRDHQRLDLVRDSETPLDFANESGSDESDGDDETSYVPLPPQSSTTNQKRGDSTVMLDVDTWLAELDTLTLTAVRELFCIQIITRCCPCYLVHEAGRSSSLKLG